MGSSLAESSQDGIGGLEELARRVQEMAKSSWDNEEYILGMQLSD